MRKISIKDVAKKAGVSIAAVSQILNNKGQRFSEATIEKVLQARDELGYVPNSAARNLKGRHKRLIGIIVPSFRMPFFADIIQSMQASAPSDVNLVFLGSTDESLQDAIFSLVERGVEALVFGRHIPNRAEVNTFLKKRNIPYLVLDQNADINAHDMVQTNEFTGGSMAASHLMSLGHRDIALILPNNLTDNMRQRRAGFLDTLSTANLTPKAIITTTLSKHGGLAAVHQLIQSKSTAAFILNDEMAIGVLRGLAYQDIKVPDDISIIGYDDTDYAEFMIPTLTTIAQPVWEIGETALKMIIRRLDHPNLPLQTEFFDVKLVIRESTGPVKNTKGNH
ncbi:ribose utilization transcriptional repressor RbsR [Leuconostoc mesenteroides]|uniref:Transcriptional regulator, LacI family n=1 Tax=Leuconostoc mesenteroides subsp. mesenteroides (strain ATCC 8293 / DSM 20343 / BCRC 11652 / CCM 1803 / JCM 6124 / NCDO 523 / NBRC 100496 / NCIMB 8023 / NCTC 12954 / NRRL B-1118 / 37Y) TaxID=203120 RepID=Q03Y18_LEUMM|nr:LacI family DNA-binding transcriptional regulator [Leuconostoc mesenteroides]ABJ61904.1 transcriptional regulator, LacI family [Leuconostoc mesenteroides subsp. mesenteroides ATCC 8293]AET30192.1 LacI family transcriptional regulator [Leuconostoc mesenteroides subsp. mesenteroides J18]AQU49175.1 LacI family transcriptional regulator [Leuconostoc mesenteroides subsp. mesenteroides]KAA8347249.1 LacI family transcriptional regulator [Leuconostoc mesenteroides]KAA8378876.1 LacI family transcrip